MITITAQPEAIDIAGNGLNFEISGSSYIEVEAILANTVLQMNSTLLDGNTFEFYDFENSVSVIVTAKTVPDETLNEIAVVATVDALISEFRKLYVIDRNYKFSKTTEGYLKVELRTAYTYTFETFNVERPPMFSFISAVDGYEAEYKPQYSFASSVYDADDSLISEFALSPDNNAAAQVKLGELLSGFALPEIPLFDAISKIITGFNYRINFAEKYEIAGALRTNKASIFEGIALPGRLSAAEADTFSLAAFTAAKNWLNTLQSADIFECNYMLYWLNYTNYTTIKVNVKFYYTDGTTEEIEADSLTVATNEILRIDVAKLLLLSTNIHHKIEVYTSYNTTALSNKYELQITELPLYNSVLYFTNKYGMFEALCLSGKSSQMLQTKRNTAVTYNNFAVSKLDEAYDKFKVGTGPILRAEAEAIKQALLSDKIYIQEDGLLVPCVVEDGSFEIIPNDEDLFELEFEYRYAYEL